MTTIEDIILQKDGRNISALRPYLPSNYVEEAADLILEHPGKVLIVTGFYIVYANAPETDGPPGAAAIGEALAAIGYEVAYVTDKYSMDVMKSVAGDKRVIEFPIADHMDSAAAAELARVNAGIKMPLTHYEKEMLPRQRGDEMQSNRPQVASGRGTGPGSYGEAAQASEFYATGRGGMQTGGGNFAGQYQVRNQYGQ